MSANSAANPAALAAQAAAGAAADARPRRWWYFLIFTTSGFAGLVYEAIWTRYLKLFLGHAAYAQALVLAIFLFGLAVGAALAGKYSARLRRPLLGYAAIEAVVALAAIYFHDFFVVATEWAFAAAIPALATPAAIEAFKWTFAALLILPQSILLGATFPLMSAGLLRLFPDRPGGVIARLYFYNSIGAAAGVLVAGFVLVDLVGLPGTLLIGGGLSALVAFAVWAIGRRYDDIAAPRATAAAEPVAARRLAILLLAVALMTGAASFVYEIAWIRMLALLLGSSTNAFELMLGAFIFGLAIGGYAVRRAADEWRNPLAALAAIQIAMGALAIATLFFYQHLFTAFAWILAALPRAANWYGGYHFASAGLSFAVMLPATICAGMTLPLITRMLVSPATGGGAAMDGRSIAGGVSGGDGGGGLGGERAVGAVYAANTAGAIVATLLAALVLMPLLGVKNLLIFGGAVDFAAGLAILLFLVPKSAAGGGAVGGRFSPRLRVAAVGGFCAVVVAAAAGVAFDPRVVSSGVYRSFRPPALQFAPVFYRDGRTATVAVFEGEDQFGGRWRNITTNGKSDALLYMDSPPGVVGGDEMTMMLSAALPLLAKPSAKRAAVVGFGSGMTTHVLLQSPDLEVVDTVEIESAMVDGARAFGDKVGRAFADPRARTRITDAKTFFLSRPQTYDIIVSEPSNPWVSGVAGLYTKEYYRTVAARLDDDGVFVQWLHLYESEPAIFASALRALAEHFADFRLFLSGANDVIILAVKSGATPEFSPAVLAAAGGEFGRYGIDSVAAAESLFLAGADLLLPYFESFAAPPNSDYYPFIDANAARARFVGATYALGLLRTNLEFPLVELMGSASPPAVAASVAEVKSTSPVWNKRAAAHRTVAVALGESPPSGESDILLRAIAGGDAPCPTRPGGRAEMAQAILTPLLGGVLVHTPPQTMARLWARVDEKPCFAELKGEARNNLDFWRTVSLRERREIIRRAEALLQGRDQLTTRNEQIVALAAMAAHYYFGEYRAAIALLERFGAPVAADIRHAARLIAANAERKEQQ